MIKMANKQAGLITVGTGNAAARIFDPSDILLPVENQTRSDPRNPLAA